MNKMREALQAIAKRAGEITEHNFFDHGEGFLFEELQEIAEQALAAEPEPAGEPVAQEPYCYVYEFDSKVFGLHRSLSTSAWNGLSPSRSVAVYTNPTPEAVRKLVEAAERMVNVLNAEQLGDTWVRTQRDELKATLAHRDAQVKQVNQQMLEALKQTRSEIWRLLDTKGVGPIVAIEWPEIVLADAAIATAEKHAAAQLSRTLNGQD